MSEVLIWNEILLGLRSSSECFKYIARYRFIAKDRLFKSSCLKQSYAFGIFYSFYRTVSFLNFR